MLKKKEKVAPATDDKLLDQLLNIDLHKYCPQKIFNVIIVNDADESTEEVTNKIIHTSAEFADISYLTFISYDEVVDLVENYEDAVFPPSVKSLLNDFTKKIKSDPKNNPIISTKYLAILMKFKLIEVMYKNYIKAVTRMHKRKKLEADLKALTEGCFSKQDAKGQKDFKNIESKSSFKKNGDLMKNGERQSVIDYTTISINTDDDIIFDDDIHHQISFYIFHGFYVPKLIQQLIVNNKVPIQAVVKITTYLTKNTEKIRKTGESSTVYSQYWDQIYRYFDGPERCKFLENTFLMNYVPVGVGFKQIFEELLNVLRGISNIKLNHLNYIRHLKIFSVKEVYNNFPLELFTVYNNYLQNIPLELTNVPVILDTLLKQVCVGVEETFTLSGNTSRNTILQSSTFEIDKCIDPCCIQAFLKRVKVASEPCPLRKIGEKRRSFMTHENDELTIILNSYKKYGALVYETTMKMLKNLEPLRDINDFEIDCTEVIHKHDVDPSTKTILGERDSVLHFLYMFLFSFYEHKFILPKIIDTDLVSNIETYNRLDFIRHSQTTTIDYRIDIEEEEIPQHNLYDTAPIEYIWKEKLEPSVLLREIDKAGKDYLYCDKRFSPETNTLLLQFSDCLDEFGLNTKIYDETLKTPVCLRDFCKYTIVEQSEWLDANKPPRYIRKCAVREECQGARQLLDLFPEYSYLIEAEFKKEPDLDLSSIIDIKFEEITFEQLVEEIKNYPSNSEIINECVNSHKRKDFLVYDLGTKYIQVKGARTIFQSHDDVKLSIDNTRLLDEHPKCSLNLQCRNNTLIVHSNKFYLKEDFNFHMNLADGTIVSFFVPKSKKPKRSSKTSHPSPEPEKETDDLKSEQSKSIEEKYEDAKILSVDQNHFDNIANDLLNEQYENSKEVVFKPPETMLQSLKEAVASDIPIYKVNSNPTFVKKLKSEYKIPISNIIKRVLHTTIQKEDVESFTKRYVPIKEKKHDQDIENTLNAKIALPNGLFITFYPSKSMKDFMEVKQEYLCRNSSTEQEEFRLFTKEGYILIKRIDGSITTLKSNGDIIEHKKLDTESEEVRKWSVEPCHCKNTDDYKKRLNKILKKSNEEVSDFTISRRGWLRTRKGYITNPQVTSFVENNKVPYLKTTLLKFDGNLICLESGKVSVRKVGYVTFENNFTEQEMYFERCDGFKSTIDKNGKQVVEFVDGTKITGVVHVAKDLVDGYVYISLEFKYEHPSYATVAYVAENALEILLNNNVVFKKKAGDIIQLNIDVDIVTTVEKEEVVFEKTCTKCEAKYECHINIDPLTLGELNYSDVFVHASDSYKKHFYADFEGNCKQNADYIKDPLNTADCNHYKYMSYKKLFVVNRDLSGDMFWKDNTVLNKKNSLNPDSNSCLKEYRDPVNPRIKTFKFKTNIYNHFCDRFLIRSLEESKQSLNDDPIYSTFCVLKRLLTPEKIEKYLLDLNAFLSKRNTTLQRKFLRVLEKISEQSKAISEKKVESIVKINKSIVPEVIRCKCEKDRISIQDKIVRWRKQCEKYRSLIRNREVPCYFNSEFCQIIKKK